MPECVCGRKFPSEQRLASHQADKYRDLTPRNAYVCGDLIPAAAELVSAAAAKKARTLAKKKDKAVAGQLDEPASATSTSAASARASRASSKGDKWMWRGVRALDPVRSIHISQLRPSEVSVTSDNGYELVCSYNWQQTSFPFIMVPGGPSRWQPPRLPVMLSPDSGFLHRDQNAARVPRAPFEPLFRAALVMSPAVSFDDVDVVVNRGSLVRLLNLCCNKSVRDACRLDLHLVGNTLIVELREQPSWSKATDDANDYKQSFRGEFTKYVGVLEESSGHNRAVRYQLGELDCVVQLNVDSSYEKEDEPTREENENDEAGTDQMNDDNIYEMRAALHSYATERTRDGHSDEEDSADDASTSSSLSYSDIILGDAALAQAATFLGPPTTMRDGRPSVATLAGGSITPHTSVVELRTKRVKAESLADLADAELECLVPPMLDRHWFGRTHLLINGFYHMNGMFDRVSIIDSEKSLPGWEKGHGKALRKLVALLKEMRETLRRTKEKRLIAICERKARPSILKLYRCVEDQAPLPDDVLQHFWTQDAENDMDTT